MPVELAAIPSLVEVGDNKPHIVDCMRDRGLHALALPFRRMLDLEAEVDVFRESCDRVMVFGKARAALEYYLRVGSRDGLQGEVDEVILDDERLFEVEAICRSRDEFAPVFPVFM